MFCSAPRWLVGATSLLLVMVLFWLADLAIGFVPDPAAPLVRKILTNGVFLGSAVLCLVRAVARAEERRVWLVLGLGLLPGASVISTSRSSSGIWRTSRSPLRPISGT